MGCFYLLFTTFQAVPPLPSMQCDSLLVSRVVLTAPGFVVYRDVVFSFLYLCLIMFGKALVQIELVR